MASSVVTAIVAALILVESISVLRLNANAERSLVISACYSIGLGSALTPIGEPLSTNTASRLAGPPHNADFFFLWKLLWPWLIALLITGGMLIPGNIPNKMNYLDGIAVHVFALDNSHVATRRVPPAESLRIQRCRNERGASHKLSHS